MCVCINSNSNIGEVSQVVVVHTFNQSNCETRSGQSLAFEASLVYRAGQPGYTEKPVSKNKQTGQHEKIGEVVKTLESLKTGIC